MGAINCTVTARENEDIDSLWRRFRKVCQQGAIMLEYKGRMSHATRSERRRVKHRLTLQRQAKYLRRHAEYDQRVESNGRKNTLKEIHT